jgi:RNA polymerase sigma-70 factor (ECF subfamily)
VDSQITAERFSQFRTYYDELVAYLTVKLRSRDQAQDVAQETFLRVLSHDSSAPILKPRAFLYRTAINLTVDLFRKRRRQAEESLESEDIREALSVPADQESAMEAKEQLRLLQKAILELPLRCRQVFLLHKFKGRSHAEIAEHLDISISMVEKHIIKATAYCRERFKDLS